MTDTKIGITKRSVGLFFAKALVLSAVFAVVPVEGASLGFYMVIVLALLPIAGVPLFLAALAAVAGAARLWQPFTKKRWFALYTAGLIAFIIGANWLVLNSGHITDRANLMRAKYLARRAEVMIQCENGGYSKLLDDPDITKDAQQLVMIDYDRMILSFKQSDNYSFELYSGKLKKASPDLTGLELQFENEIPSPGKRLRTYYKSSDSDTPKTALAVVEMEDGSLWWREVNESLALPANGELINVLENYDEKTVLTNTRLPENPYGMEYVSAAVVLNEEPSVTVFTRGGTIEYSDGSTAKTVYTETYHLHERDKLENVRPITCYRLSDKGDTLMFFLISWMLDDGRENAQYYGYAVMTADGKLLTEEDKYLTGYHTTDIAGICKDCGDVLSLDRMTEFPMTTIYAGDDPENIDIMIR